MAGVAAVRAASGTSLKWPNDVLRDGVKVGGILVERSDDVTVVGLGLNLWWRSAPAGMGALFSDDPGECEHARIGGPIDEYRSVCTTIGQEITWEPGGSGRAVDISSDGALVVETVSGRETIHSGAVSHVR
jgi:biotin-(acetyl-CoA carboxylase) ligase